MARLIVEPSNTKVEIITESVDGVKQYYLTGSFSSADTPNKNKRIYPMRVLKPAVEKYIEEYVNTKRAVGELNHPDSATINLDRVSHLIEDLHFEGKELMGKAKILDTPCGKQAKALLEGGVKLGVSTRALGSVREVNGVNEVQDDFMLATVDIVHDPSNYSSLVEAIYESKEWEFVDGEWQERFREPVRQASKAQLQETYFKLFKEYIDSFKVLK